MSVLRRLLTALLSPRPRLARWAAIGCTLALLALAILRPTVGEANLFLAFTAYLFPLAWLLPLPVLAWFARGPGPRVWPWLLASLVIWGLWLSGWGLGKRGNSTAFATPAETGTLTVLTANRGQSFGTSLQPFLNETQPDVLVFQDCFGGVRDKELQHDNYAAWPHALQNGEFLVLSKYPIRSAAPVPLKTDVPRDPDWPRPPAVRFVIAWGKREIALYAVHAPTPRQFLRKLQRGSFLQGLLGLPGTRWAAPRRDHEAYWRLRLAQLAELNTAVLRDPLPAVLCGDFNAAAGSRAFRLASTGLTDAHATCERGCGFTFDGSSTEPLSLNQPWLRVDAILATPEWDVLACRTETKRRSQHLAVAARLKLADTAKP